MNDAIKAAPGTARPFLFAIPKHLAPAPGVPALAPVVPRPDTEKPTTTAPEMPWSGPFNAGPYWAGETVFVVASGPSIMHTNFETIRGRKVICINSSFERVPFADILYFGDARWYEENKTTINTSFKGRVVTVTNAAKSKRFLKLSRLKPESQATGFSDRRDTVASQRTSLQGAMNLAAHLCAATNGPVGNIVLIGADMGRDDKNNSHGHKPHKWINRPGNVTWDEQMRHLKWIVPHLQTRGIRVLNCSLTSRIPWWPKMTLQDFLTLEKLSEKGGWNWADKI